MSFGWGIAGFGWVAQDYAMSALLSTGAELRAVCDPNPEARRAALALGIRQVTAHLPDLLADDAIQAIYVAAPNHLHRTVTEAALVAGKPVLCEKPMAATLADAESMVDTAARHRILLGTAFDQRHHPAHELLRSTIRSGHIGQVTAVRIVYACWLGATWRSMNPEDNWRIDAARAGGGALMDLAPHGLDLFSFLLDECVTDASAFLQRRIHDYAVDDGAMLIGNSASGTLLSLHVAYNCPETLPRRRLEIQGTSGLLVAIDTMGQDPGGQVSLFEAASGAVTTLQVPDADASPFARQMDAFRRAIVTGDAGEFDVGRDLRHMRLLHRMYESEATWR